MTLDQDYEASGRIRLKFNDVQVCDHVDEDAFKDILQAKKPVLLRDCSFGDCTNKWTLEYLNEVLRDETVIIHESQESDLDFLTKNFNYRSCPISEFFEQLASKKGEKKHVYLRSTNKSSRGKRPAKIEDDFPAISNDLVPPSFIPYGKDNKLYHSSVLRIASSNVQIWTHFDLYDNMLSQIHGTKRVILLPPEDIKNLYVSGDKSPVNNFDQPQECLREFPLIDNATLYKCILDPGDTLFIPALWWHNIRTISDGAAEYSIGLNIFWKDPEIEASYATNDTYGNKNLVPFDSALANLDKAICHLDKLPSKYRTFYKYMLLAKLGEKLFPNDQR